MEKDEKDEKAKLEENSFKSNISNIILVIFFLLLLTYFFYEFLFFLKDFDPIFINLYILISEFDMLSNSTVQNICCIFDNKVKYRVLLSLGSIAMNNPH